MIETNAASIFIFLSLKVRYDSYENFSVSYSWWNSLLKNILEILVTIKEKKKRKSDGSSKNADKNIVS